MWSETMQKHAGLIVAVYRERGLKIALAESCTGGLVSALLTEVPGASHVLERGFISYSNLAKQEQLGVDHQLIDQHGAVSAEVAQAMAEGAIRHSNADIGLAITGIAGPGGATPHKPVGLVYIATAGLRAQCEHYHFTGERHAVRLQAVENALELLSRALT